MSLKFPRQSLSKVGFFRIWVTSACFIEVGTVEDVMDLLMMSAMQ